MNTKKQLIDIRNSEKSAMYFTKTSLQRCAWKSLDSDDIVSYTMDKNYEIAGFKFNVLEKKFISVYFNDKEIALIHFGKLQIKDDKEMLEIAYNFIKNYDPNNNSFAYQNGITTLKSKGYFKITNKYYLTNCDPDNYTEDERV